MRDSGLEKASRRINPNGEKMIEILQFSGFFLFIWWLSSLVHVET